jgi:hypothetical protein
MRSKAQQDRDLVLFRLREIMEGRKPAIVLGSVRLLPEQ